MRLFAALEIPDDIRDGLQDWWLEVHADLDTDVWCDVPSHLWHVTLAFYGEVSGHDADDLAEGLCECAQNTSPLHLYTSGFGVFPKPARPKVFWAGVHEVGEIDRLKHLARCCRRVGHDTVRRQVDGKRGAKEASFRGHGKAPFGWLDRDFPGPPVMDWRCSHLCLFQSILRPEGPQYRRLESFACTAPLMGAQD